MCGLDLSNVFEIRLLYYGVLCFGCPRSSVMIVTFV